MISSKPRQGPKWVNDGLLTSDAKVKCEKFDVRVLFARENLTRFSYCRLLIEKYWWPGTESNRRRRPFQAAYRIAEVVLKSTDLAEDKGLHCTYFRTMWAILGGFWLLDVRVLFARLEKNLQMLVA